MKKKLMFVAPANSIHAHKWINYFTKEYVKGQIIERFMPWESYEDAEFQFKYKIDTNTNSYTGNIIDYFHKKSKSSDSNSGDNSDTIYETVLNTWDTTSKLGCNIGNGFKNLIWNRK